MESPTLTLSLSLSLSSSLLPFLFFCVIRSSRYRAVSTVHWSFSKFLGRVKLVDVCTNNFFLITSSENIIPMITRSKTFKNLAYLSISAPLKKNNNFNACKRRKEIESVGRRSPSICVGPYLQMSVSIYISRSPSRCRSLHLDISVSI